MPVTIEYTTDALADLDRLPTTIKARVLTVLHRLEAWPHVSGAKPMQREWTGHYRIRTGDWRVIFRVVRPNVLVVRIRNRRDVYDP